MSDQRAWYRQPETFVAIAALVVSVSAVAVAVYEAALQRAHDRAEVWPHLELSTFTSATSATLSVDNNGIGPAIVDSIDVTVDGKPQRNWPAAFEALTGKAPVHYSNETISDRALRAGERTIVVEVPIAELPSGFWQYIGRVGVRICYSSVFGEHWQFTADHVGGKRTWTSVPSCPAQPPNADF